LLLNGTLNLIYFPKTKREILFIYKHFADMMHEKDDATTNQETPDMANNENVNSSENHTEEVSPQETSQEEIQEEETLITSEEVESEVVNTEVKATEISDEEITLEEISTTEIPTEETISEEIAETESPPIIQETSSTEIEESVTNETLEELSQEDSEEEETAETDYSQFSKPEFLDLLKRLEKEEDLRKFAPILREVRPMFDEILQEEKEAALKKYLEEGGEEDGFEYKEDEDTQEFYRLYGEMQKRRHEYKSKQEQNREQNFQRKNEILDLIRKLLENPESSLDELKKLQKEWKEVGPVQPQLNRNLWASYNALLDLFYDQRSIHFELVELDRKKNLALKLVLCEKAEKLVEYEIINQAIKELNELHEEFKHVGPVPKEEREALWLRFKAASDRVYDRKRDYHRNLEEEKQKNLLEKIKLCEAITPFVEFQSDKVSEWNAKTKEILALQKQWEAIRFIPREQVKEVSKTFWNPFKTFFNNKNTFIRTLDEEREENFRQKTVLCEEADQLVNGDHDPKAVADQLKALQQKWKDIGPVPAKQRQSIYDRFKATCDSFFERRRKAYSEQEKEYDDNLLKKVTLCEKIEQLQPNEETSNDLVNQLIKEWRAIGFVPRKDKNKIQARFDQAIDTLINRLPKANEVAREKTRISAQMKLAKDSPNAQRNMNQLEGSLRRKISTLENEIDILLNNIGFLANSKKADKLKDSLNLQIDTATKELDTLRNQLKALKQMD
jgi:disulfide oxidoreductase YuzD